MDELIATIISIEEEAQKVIADAREQERTLEDTIAQSADEMHSDIEKRVHARCEKIKAYEAEQTPKKIAEITAALDERKAYLDQKYEANCEIWVNDIFNNIISRKEVS